MLALTFSNTDDGKATGTQDHPHCHPRPSPSKEALRHTDPNSLTHTRRFPETGDVQRHTDTETEAGALEICSFPRTDRNGDLQTGDLWTPTREHFETARNGDPPPPCIQRAPSASPAHRSRHHPQPSISTPGRALQRPSPARPPPQRDPAAAPGGAGRAALGSPTLAGPGALPALTLGGPPCRGAGRGRKLTFRWKRPARRGTPARPGAGAARSWGGGVPEPVLTPLAPPPPPLCLGPPAPIPLPWRAPTSCSRARGASVGAPHGAASPPPRRARPAQSARAPRPQRSPAPRGARASRQRGRGSAGARARPMVPGVPAPRSPLPRSFLLPPKRKKKQKEKKKMIKLLEAGCWRSPETEQGRARARGGR